MRCLAKRVQISCFVLAVFSLAIFCSAAIAADDRTGSPAAPFVEDVVPSSGSGTQRDFFFTYGDTFGPQFLGFLEVIFGDSKDDPDALFVSLELATNKVRIGDNGRFGGPFAENFAGRFETIGNALATINLARVSTTQLDERRLQLRLFLDFRESAFRGSSKKIFMRAIDLQSAGTEFVEVGTFNILNTPTSNRTPSSIKVTPRNSEGRKATLDFEFEDLDGKSDIEKIHILFSTDKNRWFEALNITVFPLSGEVVLESLARAEGGTIGSGRLGNTFAVLKLNQARFVDFSNPNRLKLLLPIEFKKPFTGKWKIYMNVVDVSGAQRGLKKKGSYEVTRGDFAPLPILVTPINASATVSTAERRTLPVRYTAYFIDRDGFDDIDWLELKFVPPGGAGNSVIVRYEPTFNRVSMRDNEDGRLPGTEKLGSLNNIEIPFARLHTKTSSGFRFLPMTVGMRLDIEFLDTLRGEFSVLARGRDFGGNQRHWKWLGTIKLGTDNVAPRADSVSPFFEQGTGRRFAFTFSDLDGSNDIKFALIRFTKNNRRAATNDGVQLVYDAEKRELFLIQDGEAKGKRIALGGRIVQPRATVNNESTILHYVENTMTLYIRLDFDPELMNGLYNIWMKAQDTEGRGAPWRIVGGYEIPEP